jgi:hypothetical protein
VPIPSFRKLHDIWSIFAFVDREVSLDTDVVQIVPEFDMLVLFPPVGRIGQVARKNIRTPPIM